MCKFGPDLRPYQIDLLERAREEFRDKLDDTGAVIKKAVTSCLLQAPTGTGKTEIAAAIAAGAIEKGYRVIFCMHRRNLVRQFAKRFKRYGIKFGYIASGMAEDETALVHIATTQTLIKRLKEGLEPPALLVIDECHRAGATSFKEMFNSVKAAGGHLLGLTATPRRLDGKGLDETFESLVCAPQVKWFIQEGYLVQPLLYAPPNDVDLTGVGVRNGEWIEKDVAKAVRKSKIVGDAIKTYKTLSLKHYGRPLMKAVAFCCDIAHAQETAEKFTAAGVPAKAIHGKMSDAELEQILNEFESGSVQLLTSCDLITEGFDVPTIEAVIMLRPTKSLMIYLQAIGRGLRPDLGKLFVLIIDHVGNCFEHAFPDADRDWSLGGTLKGDVERVPPSKRCPFCFAVFPPATKICPQCEKEIPVNTREILNIAGQLELMREEKLQAMKAHEEQMAERKKRLKAAKTYAEVAALGEEWGHAAGWAQVQWTMKSAGAKREYLTRFRKSG